jgi:hypothetical protein
LHYRQLVQESPPLRHVNQFDKSPPQTVGSRSLAAGLEKVTGRDGGDALDVFGIGETAIASKPVLNCHSIA